MEQAASSPEFYVRANITKQSKGYVSETTVSVRWRQDASRVWTNPEPDVREGGDDFLIRTCSDLESDTPIDDPLPVVLRRLFQLSDDECRKEIARREALDAKGGER